MFTEGQFEAIKYKQEEFIFVRFQKLMAAHSSLRTENMLGICVSGVPKRNAYVDIVGESIDPAAAFRHVNTSKIVQVLTESTKWTVHTQSGSVYSIEILNEEEISDSLRNLHDRLTTPKYELFFPCENGETH